MNPFHPKVSIIIPVYNGSAYLEKTINSALSQTYQNIEVIVVNDGSTDNGSTERIALSFGEQIIYIKKENGGTASALNAGILIMTGDYFSWLSHDDKYYPEKIEKQIVTLEKFNDYTAIVACNVTIIDDHDQIIKSNYIDNRINKSLACFLALDTDTGLNGCSLLIPKVLFDRYGLFDPLLQTTQDYEMWFRLSTNSRLILVEDELVYSRTHNKQTSRLLSVIATQEADKLHSKILSTISLPIIMDFIDQKVEYLEKAYTIFLHSGYLKTATLIFSNIIKIFISIGKYERASQLILEKLDKPRFFFSGSDQPSILPILDQYQMNLKPTIILFTSVWIKGGLERVVSVQINELIKTYNIILLTSSSNNSDISGFPLDPNICHIFFPEYLLPDLAYILILISSLANSNLIIIHPNIFMEVLSIYPILSDIGIKTIAVNHYHYFLPSMYTWLYPLMEKRLTLLNHATVSTWLTRFSANTYALQNDNSAYMANPITLEIDNDSSTLKDKNQIICIGRFSDSLKRVDRMFKVFKQVVILKPEAKLILVGDVNLDNHISATSNKTLEELIQELELPPESFNFVGEQYDVRPFYERASILMMTSDLEGFGVVLTEAGKYGIPSVVFNFSGLEEIIIDGMNGYVLPQDDIQGMARKIYDLLSDDNLRLSMGLNAVKLANRFSLVTNITRWKSLIQTILEYEDPDKLKIELNKRFIEPCDNQNTFIKTLTHEYEKSIQSIISCFPQEKKLEINNKLIHSIAQYGLNKTIFKIWNKLKRYMNR